MSREDEIKSRLEKATKGPWEVGGPYPSLCVMVCVDGGSTHPEYAEPPHYEMVCKIYDSAPEYLYECAWQGKADADFIAHAREDVPYLLAENTRLRRELEKKEKLVAAFVAESHRACDEAAEAADLSL